MSKKSDLFKSRIKEYAKKKLDRQAVKHSNYSNNDDSVYRCLKWDEEHGQLSKLNMSLYKKLKKQFEGGN